MYFTFWSCGEILSRGITMDALPPYVKSWIITRTQETRYQCSLCTSGYLTHHGDIAGIRCHLRSRQHIEKIMQQEALFCKVCQLQCKFPSQYKLHLDTKAHKQKENPQPKVKKIYRCELCDVVFQSQKDELRHLVTKKHMNMISFEESFSGSHM